MSLGHAGPFELSARLAKGGLGEVFLARDPSVGGNPRDVVVKRLFPNWVRELKALAMFEHEARLLAAIAHPVVPQVYAHARDEHGPFIAMEFVPGVDLGAVLGRGTPMPVEHALTIAVQLLEALAHVHTRADANGEPLRVVHRDVHPWNVRIAPDGHAGLLDFGIAQSAWLAAERGDARGTAGYIAPEAWMGDAVDARADLFAVGVVLWEMLTAKRLFDGGALRAMNAICEGERVGPSAVVAGVASGLDAVVLRALAIDPSMRPATAAEMLGDVESVAERARLLLSRARAARWVREVMGR